MWINSFIWFGVTILFSLLASMINNFLKVKSDASIKESRQETLKSKKFKSVKEQMEYVRNKSDLGKDYVFTALNIVFFYVSFKLLLYPLITNMLIGIIGSILFASVFAFISAKHIFSTKYFKQNFVSKLIGISFVGVFLSYLKLVEVFHPIIMVVVTLGLMISINLVISKWRKKKWL